MEQALAPRCTAKRKKACEYRDESLHAGSVRCVRDNPSEEKVALSIALPAELLIELALAFDRAKWSQLDVVP